MNRRGLLIRALGLAAVAGGAWWARENLIWPDPAVEFDADGATPWLAYSRRSNVPTIEVEIEGRREIALIDSGAQYSVIDRDLVADLPPRRRQIIDIPLVAYGVGGRSQMGRGTTLDVDLPGLAVRGLRAAILDLGPLALEEGLGTRLILGQDLLGQLVLAMEPDARHIRLIARDAFIRPPELRSADTRRAGGGLHAEVSVEGSTLQAIVDTGASGVLTLDQEAATASGLLDGRPSEAGASLVLGGQHPARIVEARTVTFADQLYRRVRVGVVAQPPLPNFPGALVGMAAFEGRRAAMDLGRGELWLSRPLDLTVN